MTDRLALPACICSVPAFYEEQLRSLASRENATPAVNTVCC